MLGVIALSAQISGQIVHVPFSTILHDVFGQYIDIICRVSFRFTLSLESTMPHNTCMFECIYACMYAGVYVCTHWYASFHA